MTIRYVSDNMMKLYNKQIMTERQNTGRAKGETFKDVVTISEEGKKQMMERVKKEDIENLAIKR